MAYSTAKVEAIQDAAQNMIDAAEDLLAAREGGDVDDKRDANESFEDAVADMAGLIGKGK